jgi:HEAT repeat protein
MRRLLQLWRERLSLARDNLQDPQVRAFLNDCLPKIVEAFTAHPEENTTRRDAMEILAAARDPRAIPAFISALQFSMGNNDAETIALNAASTVEAMCAPPGAARGAAPPTECPRGNAALSTALTGAIDRAIGSSGNAPRIRENVIQALGALGDRGSVERLKTLLMRPIDQQEIRTARAAADALGTLGDASAADALVYGLYLNVRRANATNNCARALVRLGADAAVPKLVETLRPIGNPIVTQLLQSYGSVPGASAPPPDYQQSAAIDVLRNFADPRGIDPLLALLRDDPTMRATPDAHVTMNVRAAAAETLAYTGLALPAADPRRAQIFDAISAVFRAGTPGGEDDLSTSVAPALVLLGDVRAVDLLVTRLRARELQGGDKVPFRLGLLLPLASAVRHASFAQFNELATQAQTELDALIAANPNERAQVAPVLAQLQTIRAVGGVARDCNDGDLACYQGKLGDREKAVVRKAAYMIAWTGGENAAARQALLERADSTDPLARRSINVAIDSLSPHGCAECITRFEAIITAERGQESRSLMNLEQEMLIARLRARAGH